MYDLGTCLDVTFFRVYVSCRDDASCFVCKSKILNAETLQNKPQASHSQGVRVHLCLPDTHTYNNSLYSLNVGYR